jgi:hypothetical protein
MMQWHLNCDGWATNKMFLKKKYPKRTSQWPFFVDHPEVETEILHRGEPPYVGNDEMVDFIEIEDIWSNVIEEIKGSGANPWNRINVFCAELDGWVILYECKWYHDFGVRRRRYLIGFEFEEDYMAFKLRWS